MVIKFGNGFLYATPVLAGYFLLVGLSPDKKRQTNAITCLSTLIIMGLGFHVTYVTTPHDLTWHLDNSLDRLMLQLWPSFLLLFFQVVTTPSEVRLEHSTGCGRNKPGGQAGTC